MQDRNNKQPNVPLYCDIGNMQPIHSADVGWVFNIQKFSLHDGPGIRDVVFLKGCPLRCRWCSNPESQSVTPEIIYKESECIGFIQCGLCENKCPTGAIRSDGEGKMQIDWSLCNHCGECAQVCPTPALELVGKRMSVNDVLDVVERDGTFHSRSGGGITISGGDPLVQAAFVSSLLRACKKRLIHTAVETTGYGAWNKLEQTIQNADMVLYDIKSMNSQKHKEFTGVSNEIILENLLHLATAFPRLPIIVRTPVIPGFNDTDKDIQEIVTFLKTVASLEDYQLLPFHRLGMPKYAYQGKTCEYAETIPPDGVTMDRLKLIAAQFR